MRKLSFREILMASALVAMTCGVISARARGADPPTIEEDGEDDEHVLNIPGIGRIPMPPGTRVFQPRAPRPPTAEAPAPPKSPDQRRAEAQERLFARLAEAEDEAQAQMIAGAILRDWARSGSDTIDLLTARAAAAETAGSTPLAKTLLDHVVTLSPYWAEGFVRRARITAARGDAAGALGDLETAARLEPRRFDAWAALGALAEQTGEKKRALEAYRKSLAISPRQDALRKTEERLRLEVEGRDI
jgi:tetratricopeptide (TPR) repeat protein